MKPTYILVFVRWKHITRHLPDDFYDVKPVFKISKTLLDLIMSDGELVKGSFKSNIAPMLFPGGHDDPNRVMGTIWYKRNET